MGFLMLFNRNFVFHCILEAKNGILGRQAEKAWFRIEPCTLNTYFSLKNDILSAKSEKKKIFSSFTNFFHLWELSGMVITNKSQAQTQTQA